MKADIIKKRLAEEIKNCGMTTVEISTKTGEGMPALFEEILKLLDEISQGDSLRKADAVRLTNTRQRDAAVKAKDALVLARKTVNEGFPPDMCAVDLENAAAFLGEIVGLTVSEEIVDKIFHNFCLGNFVHQFIEHSSKEGAN